MTGAIEFLTKAKAICESVPILHCDECPLTSICGDFSGKSNQAGLVRKVMAYQLPKEDKDAEGK